MPAILIEKPKLSRPMWNALKFHIIRERRRKKQEQEADAEVERQRREREDQQKEQEMTLEETKEQVAQSEQRLSQLKEDKHQLFLQLKKVLNEDDTRRKIKESNFNDMVLLHGYPSAAPPLGISNPNNQGPSVYLPSIDNRPRPPFKTGKDDVMLNAPAQSSIYAQSISLIPSNTVGPQTQPNSKRTRSPSPPPQFYHAYKPHSLSSYNSKNVGNSYTSNHPVPPGSIFYTHSLSVSAAHNASNASYQIPALSSFSYPSTPSSAPSRPSFSTQVNLSSKDDGTVAKHANPFIGQGSSLSQMPQRAHMPRSTGQPLAQGFHHPPIDHLVTKTSNSIYASSEQENSTFSSYGLNVAGSSSNSSLRPHGLNSLSGVSHPSGSLPSALPIQQQRNDLLKTSGSITSGMPIQLRPPASTSYLTTIPSSQVPSPRLVYTQSSGQPPHPGGRYYGTANQRDL